MNFTQNAHIRGENYCILYSVPMFYLEGGELNRKGGLDKFHLQWGGGVERTGLILGGDFIENTVCFILLSYLCGQKPQA